jgi:hypothetical protein
MAVRTGSTVVQSTSEFTVADGELDGISAIGSNFGYVSNDDDFQRIEVGTEILVEDSPYYFNDIVIGITPENKNIEFSKAYDSTGSHPFSFRRAPLVLRHIEPTIPYEGAQQVDKHILDGYFDKVGEYVPLNVGAQSFCLINGKNASSQSLTSGVETVVEWDDGLVWFDPLGEWKLSSDPTNPYHFVPEANGLYAVWANFSIFATSSSVGDLIKASLSMPSPAWHFLEIVHQRPDLDFVGTFRRNIDLQGMVYLQADQPLGVYVTSECATSVVSNTYTMMLSIKRLMKYA